MVCDARDIQAGQRVRVNPDAGWPAAPNGVVVEHPMAPEDQIWRPIDTTFGPAKFYWVVFDVPQVDGDGDGGYAEGEVLDRHLERID